MANLKLVFPITAHFREPGRGGISDTTEAMFGDPDRDFLRLPRHSQPPLLNYES